MFVSSLIRPNSQWQQKQWRLLGARQSLTNVTNWAIVGPLIVQTHLVDWHCILSNTHWKSMERYIYLVCVVCRGGCVENGIAIPSVLFSPAAMYANLYLFSYFMRNVDLRSIYYGVVFRPKFQFSYVQCYFGIQHSMHHSIVTCDMLFWYSMCNAAFHLIRFWH